MKISKLLFLSLLVAAGVCNQSHAMDATQQIINALYENIRKGHAERVRENIQKIGVDLFKKTGTFERKTRPDEGEEFTPLQLACAHGKLAIVRLLVEEYGTDVNEGYLHSEAVGEAMTNLYPEVMQYLMSKGAKPKQKWIKQLKNNLQNPNNRNSPERGKAQRILYYMQGTKIIAGVPMTRVNMGIIAVVCVAGLATVKYLYDRHYKNKKKNRVDADEMDDAQRELNAEVV